MGEYRGGENGLSKFLGIAGQIIIPLLLTLIVYGIYDIATVIDQVRSVSADVSEIKADVRAASPIPAQIAAMSLREDRLATYAKEAHDMAEASNTTANVAHNLAENAEARIEAIITALGRRTDMQDVPSRQQAGSGGRR